LFIFIKSEASGESDKDQNINIIKNIGTIILSSAAMLLAMILTAILIKYAKIPFVKKVADSLK
jgi:hypothetical protein